MLFRPSLVGALGLGCATLAATLGGCAHGEVRQVIRAQFAAELSCREVSLRKRDVWYSYDCPDQYKVSGCGVIRTYTCPAGDGMASYDEPACTWVAGDADAPQLATMVSDADRGEPPMDGAGEPMDADEELDAADDDRSSSDDDGEASDSDLDAEAAEEPAKKSVAKPKAPAVKASGGLKLGGKKK
jgi:hypothetical protein